MSIYATLVRFHCKFAWLFAIESMAFLVEFFRLSSNLVLWKIWNINVQEFSNYSGRYSFPLNQFLNTFFESIKGCWSHDKTDNTSFDMAICNFWRWKKIDWHCEVAYHSCMVLLFFTWKWWIFERCICIMFQDFIFE